MDCNKIIQDALSEGRTSLTEFESKQILAQYGVPVVAELKAKTPDEAADAAIKIGFPVVLKGLGVEFAHKTEMGLVLTGLKDADAVLEAAKKIKKRASLAGFLVQPHVRGDREFVAGLFTDPQFGPVVMFGIGGVFTEALNDVAFRLAPCLETDIEDMLEEIHAKALFDDFRGQKKIDRQLIMQTLLGLSRLAVEIPEISEIDINPLKAGPDGSLVAVDALIILGGKQKKAEFPPPVLPEEFAPFFQPRSIAFVGASAQIGKWGHLVSTNVIAGGYKGDIYLVNAKGGEIMGRPAYRSVKEIPGKVDLAVVTIPAAHVAGLFSEFQEKGISHVLLITSGFGETGPKGKALEKELEQKAREYGIVIMGPNTMGICNPHIKLYCLGSHIRTEPGPTALVSQSGNMGAQLLGFAKDQGIGIRAFCGSGNEAMITIEDGLEAFEGDDITKTVVLYLESVKNGRRFFESARRLGRTKPVVVLKGGRTKVGGRAAASHTGAMASDVRIFDAACRQAGVVSVVRPMELLDLSAAFSSLPLPLGNRVAIITLGGGWGVVTADLCDQFGLKVPKLTPELIKAVDQYLPPYWSRANPIDLVGERDPKLFKGVTEELMRWDGCDAVIVLGTMGRRHSFAKMIQSAITSDPNADKDFFSFLHGALSDFEHDYVKFLAHLMEKHNKPVIGVPIARAETDKTVIQVPESRYSGIFFDTPERAVIALARMYEYQRFFKR